jgi:hypothetical protein
LPELLELLLPRSALLQSAVHAMALNHVGTAIVKWPAQPLLDAENVQVQRGFLECFVDNHSLNIMLEYTVGV